MNEYWNFEQLWSWCNEFANQHSEWVHLEILTHTREGRPIFLLTLGLNPQSTPTLWVDAATHASEWTGVMTIVYALQEWSKWFLEEEGGKWFEQNSICVLPCMSPDGFQALHDGKAYLRSSTRPSKAGVKSVGFQAQDVDGDGRVLWMRWKDPAGPFVRDEESDFGLRKRHLGDATNQAYFLSSEGMFGNWDGFTWTQAPLKHGLDLNRNFPINWQPFEMFGMDGGIFSLSEPESRAVMDAVSQRPNIILAVSLHTYTGAILTQPYHENSPLSDSDIAILENLAQQSVRGTNYRSFRVYPDFTYDMKQPIIGVWADCLSSTLGIPAYTLELWDPFRWAGVSLKDPASFFKRPNEQIVEALLRKGAQEGLLFWRNFDHPQLGPVEIGGFDYLRTIRNPPPNLLEEECHRGWTVLRNMMAALPKIRVQSQVSLVGIDTVKVEIYFENQGFLSTSGLQRATQLKLCTGIEVDLQLEEGIFLLHGRQTQYADHLEGWGLWQTDSAKNAIYPELPKSGHRWTTSWSLQGQGSICIHWKAGRAGSGQCIVDLNRDEDSDQMRLW